MSSEDMFKQNLANRKLGFDLDFNIEKNLDENLSQEELYNIKKNLEDLAICISRIFRRS